MGIELSEDPLGTEMTPPMVESFEGLGALPHWMLDALREDGCYEPTPLQQQALPIALAGQNMAVVAKAGSGQAMAYLLPAAVHMEDQPPISEEDSAHHRQCDGQQM